MTGWLQTHDGLVALLQVAVWLLCLGLAAPSLLRWGKEQPRWFLALLPTLGLASAAISLWWIPSLARFEPLGHSASYFDCYTGNADPSGAVGWEAYVTYPLLRWWHWLLGAVFGGETPRVPLLFEALARGAGVVFVGAAGAVLGRRPSVGAVAAVLLMVHSVHAFWGGTVFNVAIPLAFALLCLWLALLAWRTGQTRLLLAAAASGSLVVAGRVEWGLLAPAQCGMCSPVWWAGSPRRAQRGDRPRDRRGHRLRRREQRVWRGHRMEVPIWSRRCKRSSTSRARNILGGCFRMRGSKRLMWRLWERE